MVTAGYNGNQSPDKIIVETFFLTNQPRDRLLRKRARRY
jgi:hypothetical protein